MTTTRRAVLRAAATGSLAAGLASLAADGALATATTPDPASLAVGDGDGEATFPQGVASADPTPAGVLLWTRVSPEAFVPGASLGVQVAPTAEFDDPVYEGRVGGEAVTPLHDYTVRVDLDGALPSDARLHYRFVYRGVPSPVGRCRTLPAPDSSPERLRLAVGSCNNYHTGHFGVFDRIARADVDYLLHLGDFVYERTRPSPYGRTVDLPSGGRTARTTEDFRALYRAYRSDASLRRALAAHTLIATWDDHEVANDRYWDYEADEPGAVRHPAADDPETLRRIHLEAIRAWWEYVPARVEYRPTAEAVRDRIRLYRSFRFGDLVDLFVTDERLHRSAPPIRGRPADRDGDGERDTRTMLGDTQREWLLDGLRGTTATWTAWANEVLFQPFNLDEADEDSPAERVNYDAWDGYEAERRAIADVAAEHVENLVVLSGDLHSTAVGYVHRRYGRAGRKLPTAENRIGVEFMSPALTSPNIAELALERRSFAYSPLLSERAFEAIVLENNPHMRAFNSSRWGYGLVEFTPEACTFEVRAVDKTVARTPAPQRRLYRFRVPAGRPRLRAEHRASSRRSIASMLGELPGYDLGSVLSRLRGD